MDVRWRPPDTRHRRLLVMTWLDADLFLVKLGWAVAPDIGLMANAGWHTVGSLAPRTQSKSSGSGCIPETIASGIAISSQLMRSSTTTVMSRVDCSAKPVAFDPCISIPRSNGSTINQIGIRGHSMAEGGIPSTIVLLFHLFEEFSILLYRLSIVSCSRSRIVTQCLSTLTMCSLRNDRKTLLT